MPSTHRCPALAHQCVLTTVGHEWGWNFLCDGLHKADNLPMSSIGRLPSCIAIKCAAGRLPGEVSGCLPLPLALRCSWTHSLATTLAARGLASRSQRRGRTRSRLSAGCKGGRQYGPVGTPPEEAGQPHSGSC